MSEVVERVTTNSQGYRLLVSQHDTTTQINQISKTLFSKLKTIPTEGFVRFKLMRKAITGPDTIEVTEGPGENFAKSTIVSYPKNYGVLKQFEILDPYLGMNVTIGLVASFKQDSGLLTPVIDYKAEELTFKRDNSASITLYGNNIRHQMLYQLLQLHPANKDNVMISLTTGERLKFPIQVNESKFQFFQELSEVEKVERENVNFEVKLRVMNALSNLQRQGAVMVLRQLWATNSINPAANGELSSIPEHGLGDLFHKLGKAADKRPESIDQALGGDKVIAWRKVYQARASGRFQYLNNTLSFDGELLSAECDEKDALRLVMEHIVNNNIDVELTDNPTQAVEPITNAQAVKPGRRSRNES